MNFLPKEIENIITNYKEQMETLQSEIGNHLRFILNEWDKTFYITYDCSCCCASTCCKSIARKFNQINNYTRKHKSYIVLAGANDQDFLRICELYDIPTRKFSVFDYNYNDFKYVNYGHNKIQQFINNITDPRTTLLNDIEKTKNNIALYTRQLKMMNDLLPILLEKLKSME